MQPTLNTEIDNASIDGDIVYINKYRDYDVGDIVVANFGNETRPIIKRLIGLEGDVIRIEAEAEHYNLLVNEEILYSRPITHITNHGEEGGSFAYYQTYLTYIAQHRGTARVVTNSEGDECIKIGTNECYLMGDNWGESTDSISYGTLNVDAIIGVVDIIIPAGENQFEILFRSIWNILI